MRRAEPPATRPTGTSLQLRDVSHRFGELETLAGVSLGVGAGETVAIVGPSGCGKTTLLSVIAGILD